MSKLKKSRAKARRPARTPTAFDVFAVIERRRRADRSSQPLTPERQGNVCIAYHQAIDAMIGGYAEEYHLDTIIYALGIGVVLADTGLGAEHVELLRAAMAGAARTKDRYLAGGRIGLDGDALAAIRAAYELHQEQIRVATLGELEAAIAEMHRRVAETNLGPEETFA